MTTNVNATPATLSNSVAPLALLHDMVTSHGTYENATMAFAATVERAAAGGIKSGDLGGKPAGKYYVETKVMVAHARLNPEELALWSDKSVKQTKGSPKQTIDAKLNNVMSRLRDALASIETAAATAVATGKVAEPAKKGKKATTASFADLQAGDLTKLHNRAEKDEADYGEFQATLIRAADLIGLAWANGKFAAKK